MPTGFFPIIYVRGYAARQAEINEAADDPFCGFNLGSTAHRPNAAMAYPERIAFEGPLVRLMHDWGYIDTIEQGKHNQPPVSSVHRINPQRSVWIYRYYDGQSSRFLDKQTVSTRDEMLEMGRNLYKFVGEVRQATGAEKVHLVAHSMGGLVCRCLIQKIYLERKDEAPARSVAEIARLFTYATPHNGIESQYGPLDYVGGFFTGMGVLGSDVFRHDKMAGYLTEAGSTVGFTPNKITGLSVDDVYCLVGTNSSDYPAVNGWAKTLIGPDSDGLVLTRNAFIKGAGRAQLHRSHSGPFGIVNSEEAYHLLANFLFGGMLLLEVDRGDVPPSPDDDPTGLQVDVKVSRANATEMTSHASRARYCPVKLPPKFLYGEAKTLLALPVPAFSQNNPLEYRVEFGFHLTRSEDASDRFLTPDWTGVLAIHCSNEYALRIAWQGGSTVFARSHAPMPESFGLLHTPIQIRARWREFPKPDPQNVNAGHPWGIGPGGERIAEEQAEEFHQFGLAPPLVRAIARGQQHMGQGAAE